MTQAYRVSGGAAQFVNGGLGGHCLSIAQQEYRRGFNDALDNKEGQIHPSKSYQRGYDAYLVQRRLFNDKIQLSKVLKELDLTLVEYNQMKLNR